MKKCILWLTMAVLTLSVSWSARAEGASFLAILSGDEEVPANASKARGVAIFSLADDGETVHYMLIVANLNNPVAAHIHTAPPGENGSVSQGLFSREPGTGRTSGVIAEGSFTATPELLMEMALGGTYVNVHTNDGVDPAGTGPGDLPPGEIRGQIRPVGAGN